MIAESAMIAATMPSPFGHALGGLAAAWAVDLIPGDRAWRTAPESASWFARAGNGLTLACVGLGMAPDLDLAWVTHRTVTHSVGAVAFAGIFAAALAANAQRPIGRVALMCTAAYATHLLLDWLAVDLSAPRGIQALWPFRFEWFISDFDLFRQTERRHLWSAATMLKNSKAILGEILILGPIVVGLWLVRVKALARFASEVARRNHAAQ
jgi:inner membrane protein